MMFRLIFGALIAIPAFAVATNMYSADTPKGYPSGEAVDASPACPCGQCEAGCSCCTEGVCVCDTCECTDCGCTDESAACCAADGLAAGCCAASDVGQTADAFDSIDGDRFTEAVCSCGNCEEGCECCIGNDCVCVDCRCDLCAS